MKKLNLTIQGKEVVLNFGANWFFEYYEKDSGHDLVKDPTLDLLDLGSTKLLKYLQSMVWAGYCTECSVNQQVRELKREDIEFFIMNGSEADATKLTFEIYAAYRGMSVDELKSLIDETKGEEKKN